MNQYNFQKPLNKKKKPSGVNLKLKNKNKKKNYVVRLKQIFESKSEIILKKQTNPVAINCELFETARLVPLKQPKSVNLCKQR